MRFFRFLILMVAIFHIQWSIAQSKPAPEEKRATGCFAKLENDLLTIGNTQISRIYQWNNGNIITLSLTDKASGKIWQVNGKKPDLTLPGETENAENGLFRSKMVAETTVSPEHLEVEVTYSLGKLEIKRIFRLYPDCPAIACDLYFRGESTSMWLKPAANLADMVNLEKLLSGNAGSNSPVIETVALPGRHWEIKAVEFFDITDRFNTLVKSVDALSYRPYGYRGNLLFAHDKITDNGVFFLKEAPTSNVQLAYSGSDFITESGTFRITGVGISPSDLDPKEWKKGYGFVTGVYSGDEKNSLTALRTYQKNIRLLKPGRDEMVLMNTWGDRGQDAHIRENFALAELEAGAKLGITHFQLDDGWQNGRSSNSAFKGGSLDGIWNNQQYWEPNAERFPNGLEPIVKKGKELGIEVCLWFNPSKDNSNAHWEKDADALINLYKKYGVRTFKIDGVSIPDKTAELNFRKFLDKVSLATDNQVVFNLDVTAGRRFGYHCFNEYGNLFLENRYTDWQNYYPYTTLRNLWMLSRYIPAQRLQIEFLNKWRNAGKYTGDPFGPANYSFDYLFAITMAAQPLAWFEGSGLPKEAIAAVGPVIKKYCGIQSDLHNGQIFPIGDEPSGKSWTGFHSVQKGKGFFIVFREANENQQGKLKTWLKAGTRIKCTPIIGKGQSFSAMAGTNGTITFELPEKNSYALYKYSIY
ncbi:MAG: alpha-galactosidase [Paludibacter sp.]|nr:alpha-galactosidase [Paludibacter sp.]